MTRDLGGCRELTLGGNKNVKVGSYFSRYRADSSVVRIYWNCLGRRWHRQIPFLPVPGRMPDLLHHWHIGREKGDVTGTESKNCALWQRRC